MIDKGEIFERLIEVFQDVFDDESIKVNPGTIVTFDVQFHNDFCPNTTSEPVLYKAEAMVLGEGAYLSKKEVSIIVPKSDIK